MGKLLLISGTFWLLLNFVWAKSDCEIFWNLPYSQSGKNGFAIVDYAWETGNNDYSKFLDINTQKKILMKDDLNTALLNLKKYCCENELWWLKQNSETCEVDKAFFNSNSLDSQYLFDHIFDVMMRRLNWLSSDNDIYQNTNMWVDEKWKERRERISGKAIDLSWSNPQEIIDKYNVYWTQTDPQMWYDISKKLYTTFSMDDNKFLLYVSGQWNTEDSQSVAEAIKAYDKWTLYDRYQNVCALSEYFYALLDVWLWSSDKYKVIERLSNWQVCNQAIKQQVEWEKLYVEWVEMETSNLYLSNYIEWYLWYLYDRWNKLKSLRRDSVDRFLDVVRAVPNLVNQCVK